MYAQLRIYTVNRGKMDGWVRWFNDKVMPIATQAGHHVLGPWVNEAKTEFIWIRTYQNAEDAKAKDEAFSNSAAWKAISGEAAEYVAKIEVTVMTSP